MRAVNLETFLTLPPGTMFQKYTPDYFEHLAIFEGRCGEIDFIADNFVELPIPSELIDQMMELNQPCEVREHYTGRDGCFARDQIFIVWEAADLAVLLKAVQRALTLF